ncbi:TldD/PmbA family protein [Cyanobacterium aponinum]|uniref:Peptidase U62 modulator of DNA gyrase n=1 Tax=Cyanobacterium aponinum (strain PCC 10605) TaxID=755178 RepID=K9Z1U3_CYAAP|nr:TldD/PmbA family protein [Cyanobacterium aponinum]AFZ52343.1 peptidase U62 modulator of DNA gyrase [Cyanobacterium aponinum PCC 10605]
MSKVKTIAKIAQLLASELEIKKFDIYGSSVDQTSVQVFQGEPKQVKASQKSSVIVRVWNEKEQIGVTSTTDVDEVGIELALKTALEASYFGVTDYVPDFSPSATASLPEVHRELGSQTPASDLIEKLITLETDLLNAHDAIASVPYNGLGEQAIERFYLNSDGALREENRTFTSLYLYAKTEQENKKPRSGGAYKVANSLEKLDIEGCFQETVEKTLSHLDYQPIKSGKYRVVFSPEAFLSLLGAFSNLYNAQNILDKQSLSTPESLGKQIASPLISINDNPLHEGNVSGETFDGEGTPTRNLSIIDKGVLVNFLHSSVTAKRMNAQPTGHASIGAKVSISPNYYHVFRGQSPTTEYSLAEAENVILIDDVQALHAGVNALQGSFSLPFDGWLVNKGEKVSIEAATVAGDFLDLLKSIIFVESEAEVTPSGVCPRIWVDSLSITGQ